MLFENQSESGNTYAHSGTTTQEVLRACLDRARYVNHQKPCWQTTLSIPLLQAVVWLYEHRAAKRHKRQAPSFLDALYGEPCPECGHIVVCYPLFGIVPHRECRLKAARRDYERALANKPLNLLDLNKWLTDRFNEGNNKRK